MTIYIATFKVRDPPPYLKGSTYVRSSDKGVLACWQRPLDIHICRIVLCNRPPSLMGASVTIQEAWAGDWSATAGGMGFDRRFANSSCRNSPCFFALCSFLSSSCWDSVGGVSALCVFPPTRSESLSRRQGELLGSAVCEHRPCLLAWLQCWDSSVMGLLG